jgi:sugar phosphate isomerase/epimerase
MVQWETPSTSATGSVSRARVGVQITLPFGTVEDVRNEVEELVAVLGKGGGYILGPSHAIQTGTPAENIVAMRRRVTIHPNERGSCWPVSASR